MNKIFINFQVVCKKKIFIPSKNSFKKWIFSASYLCNSSAIITLRLVNKTEIQNLNMRYRGINFPTNVLSFSLPYKLKNNLYILGDIIICPDIVNDENHFKKKKSHWAHITIHGFLHLLGYNHINKLDTLYMQCKEIEIMKKLGFANPYII